MLLQLDANPSTSKHHEFTDHRPIQAQSQYHGCANNNINGDQNETVYIPNKIFVGGLPPDITTEEFKSFFAHFGTIIDAVLMYDHAPKLPRGFGFVVFDTAETVEGVLRSQFYKLRDKIIEVKRAFRKAHNNNNSSRNNNYAGGLAGGDASPSRRYGVRMMNSFGYPGYAYGAAFQNTQTAYWIYDPTYLYYLGYHQGCWNSWMNAHSLLSAFRANGVRTWGDVH